MDTTNPTRTKLRIPNDAMYRLLREGCIIEFNAKKAAGEKVDLRGCDLRGLDLRGLRAPASTPRKFQAPTSLLN